MRNIAKAVLIRVLAYGGILWAAWLWMLWTPGSGSVQMAAITSEQTALARQIRSDVDTLAGNIGERNISNKPDQLRRTADFIACSMTAAGYQPRSQWYKVRGVDCRNIEAELRGGDRAREIVVIGAHYDSAPGAPGADDNASGVAVTLAFARWFARTRPSRTLRFVAFANEEPPYFWTADMGSLVYATQSRARGEQIVAMLSIESVGFYSAAPKTQHYPLGLGFLYPSTGDFVAFVGNLRSRRLLHDTLRAFRSAGALPSVGAALPISVPGVGWSDHWSFWQQGFPGIEVTDTAPYRNPYYHTAGDTPDRLNYEYLARFTCGMHAVVDQLANPLPR